MTKYNDKNIVYGDLYRGYIINNGKNSEYSCFKSSIDKIIDIIEEMINKHNKIHFTRIDVHPPQEMDEREQSKAMTRAIEAMLREKSRKHKYSSHNPDIIVIRTTEVGHIANNQHFHLVILSNGNAIQNSYTFHESMTRHCGRIFGTDMSGRVHNASSNNGTGFMINRNSPDFEQQMQDAIYAASYLAKTNTKQNVKKGTHKFSISHSSRN